jgi:hypothetical protein
MGVVVHAGSTGGADDIALPRQTPFANAFTAFFLANPGLQYVDFSHLQLSAIDVCTLFLEASNCNPLASEPPSGLQRLRQMSIGPVTLHSQQTCVELICAGIKEIFQNCPQLELCSLAVHAAEASCCELDLRRCCAAVQQVWESLALSNTCKASSRTSTEWHLALRTEYVLLTGLFTSSRDVLHSHVLWHGNRGMPHL